MRKYSSLLGLLIPLLAACSLGQPASIEPVSVSDEVVIPAEEVIPATLAESAAQEAGGSQRPTWQTLSLTNAHTGQTFSFADFAGKTVLVEPMATWCTNCRRQQGNLREARAQLGEDKYAYISLQIETNVSNQELAQYADDLGFEWTFAVVTPELLQELINTFGRTITNPPSTPHFIIRPDGTTTELFTGFEDATALVIKLTEISGA